MVCVFLNWARTEQGTTAVEYGLVAAGISLAIAAAVFAFGDDMAAFVAPLAEILFSGQG